MATLSEHDFQNLMRLSDQVDSGALTKQQAVQTAYLWDMPVITYGIISGLTPLEIHDALRSLCE